MKKILKIAVIILLGVIVVLGTIFFIDMYNYANGIMADTHRRFQYKKMAVVKLGFNGTVLDKEFFPKRDGELQYSVAIKVNRFDNYPPLMSRSFNPFYEISSDSIFRVCISSRLYKIISSNDSISKDSNSHSITVNNNVYSFLHGDSLKWSPD